MTALFEKNSIIYYLTRGTARPSSKRKFLTML
jgi:hypothetical protein